MADTAATQEEAGHLLGEFPKDSSSSCPEGWAHRGKRDREPDIPS